jgi:hypothetical protein
VIRKPSRTLSSLRTLRAGSQITVPVISVIHIAATKAWNLFSP